tara:strand:- start:538 stop:714 length:177 start_codon:yes stop_codon:yes gene_type:complete
MKQSKSINVLSELLFKGDNRVANIQVTRGLNKEVTIGVLAEDLLGSLERTGIMKELEG